MLLLTSLSRRTGRCFQEEERWMVSVDVFFSLLFLSFFFFYKKKRIAG